MDFKLVEFYPVEGDKEFKVLIKPLDFLSRQQCRLVLASDKPVGGNDEVEKKESPHEMLKMHMAFVSALFEKGVYRVEGCTFAGQKIEDWKGLLEVAPETITDAIVKKITEVSTLSDALSKN